MSIFQRIANLIAGAQKNPTVQIAEQIAPPILAAIQAKQPVTLPPFKVNGANVSITISF